MAVDVQRPPAARAAGFRPRRFAGRRRHTRVVLSVLSVLLGLLIWDLVSRNYTAFFLPSPRLTWQGAVELATNGTLWDSVWASSQRILSGWGLGVLIGVPVGLLMGRSRLLRLMLDPYIQFFRFVPPIAFVTLAIIWLGPGEASKIALIFYTTVFIVALNTLAGVLAVDELKLRAARALGAGPVRTLASVILPATVPYAVTGARLAMGNSFLTIVSAEIVAAQSGLGSLIWTARNYAKTEWVFVGIIALGLLGYLFDWVLRTVARASLRRYGVTF
ncbi:MULTISPECIES: ABC transporter permease [unclassified Solwaraspora]|uniref:ABC transporter permease n=1 Tax=unclassified Solwaraspora TaxID=2627926 RepID=UPI00248B57DE|nr:MULTISPECIES: ABC transporter permease [unclassified Solwaraspora]WBB99681.1 ABC transporter permease [Solwaraspora sp. WMMA2059]WBC21769.1 ABC transporter permease [Solwaraspora sp. WMMA2080]WJK36184.1 ABC transporter permease [Solwaraspora sp. WMMA2065]